MDAMVFAKSNIFLTPPPFSALCHVTGTPGGPKWELKYGQLSTLIRGEDMIYGWTIDSVSSSLTLKSVIFNITWPEHLTEVTRRPLRARIE